MCTEASVAQTQLWGSAAVLSAKPQISKKEVCPRNREREPKEEPPDASGHYAYCAEASIAVGLARGYNL